MIICYLPRRFRLSLFSTCFFRTRRTVLALCLEPSNLSDAYHLLQLILPILLHLSNGSFLTVISRCFRGIVPRHFEVFDDLLVSDRNRAIGRNSVVDREIVTRIEEVRPSGIRANECLSLAQCIESLVSSLARSRFRLRPNHQTASSFSSPHSKPASCDSSLHILALAGRACLILHLCKTDRFVARRLE